MGLFNSTGHRTKDEVMTWEWDLYGRKGAGRGGAETRGGGKNRQDAFIYMCENARENVLINKISVNLLP